MYENNDHLHINMPLPYHLQNRSLFVWGTKVFASKPSRHKTEMSDFWKLIQVGGTFYMFVQSFYWLICRFWLVSAIRGSGVRFIFHSRLKLSEQENIFCQAQLQLASTTTTSKSKYSIIITFIGRSIHPSVRQEKYTKLQLQLNRLRSTRQACPELGTAHPQLVIFIYFGPLFGLMKPLLTNL